MNPKFGILVSPENFIWTKHGLLTVGELQPGDKIIGLGPNRKIGTFELTEPISPYGSCELTTLNSRQITTTLSGEAQVSTGSGISKLNSLQPDDSVDLLHAENCERLQKMCVQPEEPNSYHGTKISPKLAYLLAKTILMPQARTEYTVKFVKEEYDKNISKFLDDINSTLKGRSYTKIGRIKGSWRFNKGHESELKSTRYFSSKTLYKLSQEINLKQENTLRWNKKTEFLMPTFVRNNGFDVIDAFFWSILDVCSTGPRSISIGTDKKDVMIRTFIKDMSWINGLRIWSATNDRGVFMIRFRKDKWEKLADRDDNFTTLEEVGTSLGIAFVLPVPANWDPIIDSIAVRRHKINYKEG